MKKYRITVNGQSYEVEVEELGSDKMQKDIVTTAPKIEAPQEKPNTAAPAPAPTTSPAPAPKKSAPAGKVSITSPMPGTILSIKVKPGTNVSKGDVVMLLEAMKMENEILAPEDGVILSIEVNEGASVNTGDLLAVME